jgi:phosphohistidine phosphatase
MKNIINGIDVLLSSPLMRANATASIVAQAINYNKKILITPFLLPDAAPKLLIAFLSKYKTKKSIMLVGHEPHMSKTASALLGSQTTIFEMKKGALCRIDIPEPSQTKTGTLIFHCPPKILRELA